MSKREAAKVEDAVGRLTPVNSEVPGLTLRQKGRWGR